MRDIYFIEKDKDFIFDKPSEVVLIGFNSSIINVTLNIKERVDIKIYCLFILSGNSHIELNTKSNHIEGDSKSRVLVKSVLTDNSRLSFNGLINIEKMAVNSDAYLKNENLVLGDNVSINSSPQLEIKNNLVRASHGVATKSVDNNHLEYLMGRGLSEKDATILIVSGFVEEIASMLPLESYEQIQKRLSNFF